MNYMGDYAVGQIVYIYFNTFDSNNPSASVTITNFANTDVHIHKDDSLTQRNNAAGVTVDVDVDAITGTHFVKIDTADNTVADFFEAGHDYFVRIEGTTVDAATVNAVVGCFSIANRRTAGQMCVSSIEGLTDQNTFTLTSGEASADDDAYNDCLIVITDQVTKIQKAVGYISDYTGSTRSVQLYASPLQTGFTMAVGDSVEIFATSAFVNVSTVNRSSQTAGDLAALINTVDDFLDTEMAAQTSNLVIIASDTVAIEVDTSTTLEARLSDVESSLVIALSDLVVIDDFLDTEIAAITSNLVIVASDTVAIEVDTSTTLEARLSDVESSLVIMKSDLVIVESNTVVIESDTIVISSDTAVIESDTTRLELTLIVATGVLEGTPSSTVLQTDLAEATDDHYNNMVFVMTSGDEAGEVRRISDYTGSSGTVTVDTALSGSPAASETFAILSTAVATAGALTTKQDSDLTHIASDIILLDAAMSDTLSELVIVKSDLVVIDDFLDTEIAAITSNLVIVASDTVAIEVDTSTTLDAAIAVIDANVDQLELGLIFGAAATGTLSTTQATTDLTGYADDQLIGRVIIWTSGDADGEGTDITDYAAASGLLTFTALTTAPGNTDTFKIV